MSNLYDSAREAVARLAPGQRLLGIDLGTKTIGIATSDLTLQIATPRHTIARGKFHADAKALLEFAKAEGVGLLVIGLPLNMDGSEGPESNPQRLLCAISRS